MVDTFEDARALAEQRCKHPFALVRPYTEHRIYGTAAILELVSGGHLEGAALDRLLSLRARRQMHPLLRLELDLARPPRAPRPTPSSSARVVGVHVAGVPVFVWLESEDLVH